MTNTVGSRLCEGAFLDSRGGARGAVTRLYEKKKKKKKNGSKKKKKARNRDADGVVRVKTERVLV